MKRTVSILATALALCACTSRTPQVDSSIELGASIMPYPRQCEYSRGVLYLDNSLISVSGRFDSRTFDYVNAFAERLSKCSSSEVDVRSFRFKPATGSTIAICYDASLPDEAYELKVDENGARISSSSHNGVVYAIATIRQMLPPAIFACDAPNASESPEVSETDWMIPFCKISDAPAYGYRGVHLDCARHFFPVEKVKKYLDIMAQYKFNRFHWHLTDDQGWRIESRKYPKLTEIGSTRAGTMVGMDWNSDDGIPHGGYYTQDELREVVAYADRLGITIVPEIDLPGHMVAALASYPELGCTGGPYEVRKTWGIAEDVLCAGKEETYRFLEDILGEVADIFPGEMFHIGGDECPKTAWKNCPHCQAKIAELGLEDKDGVSAEQYLQNYVTHRVQQMLAAKGKRVMGWDEITEGSLDKGVTVMFWRGWLPVEKTIRAYVSDGYDVVMTPNSFCYLDYAQSEDRNGEPVSYGVLTMEKMYSFDMTKGLSPEELSHVKGIQANLWTEFIQTWDEVEYMLLPRLFALSCLAWDADDRPDYDTFQKDVQLHQIPILKAWGCNYRNKGFKKEIAIVAHRGFWNCEEAGMAQNSIASLSQAQKHGFWGSEFDVNMTADGELVIFHDSSIEGKLIETHNYSDFQDYRLPNGECIPKLSAYLDQAKQKRIMLVLELKPHSCKEVEDKAVEACISQLCDKGLLKKDRVMFISFSLNACREFAKRLPGFTVQYLNTDHTPSEIHSEGINGIDSHYKAFLGFSSRYEQARSLGMSINAWTVNDKASMNSLIEMGIDQITTDNPLELRQAISASAQAVENR